MSPLIVIGVICVVIGGIGIFLYFLPHIFPNATANFKLCHATNIEPHPGASVCVQFYRTLDPDRPLKKTLKLIRRCGYRLATSDELRLATEKDPEVGKIRAIGVVSSISIAIMETGVQAGTAHKMHPGQHFAVCKM